MEQQLTTLKAIRYWCLNECQGGSTQLVKQCPKTDCVFWRYREGHDPKRRGVSPHKSSTTGQFTKLRKKKKCKRIIISGDMEFDYEK